MTKKVQLGFENDCVTIPVADILPVRVLSKSIKSSRKYTQITASIREIGLVEPPVVARNGDASGSWLLLDGHVRIEVLKDLGHGCINRLQIECGGAEFNNMYKDSDVWPKIDFVAHAAAMGAHAEKAADLERKIVEARSRDVPSVIVIDTDAVPGTGVGGHWWDVAVPQTGGPDRLEDARRRYNANAAFQNTFN